MTAESFPLTLVLKTGVYKVYFSHLLPSAASVSGYNGRKKNPTDILRPALRRAGISHPYDFM